MALKIFNVLGREKQEFTPLNPGFVNMYVCGPTTYDWSHLGHAKNYVNFDVIVRYLRFSGYNVLYVQNITDVGHLLETGEDRILQKARKLQSKPMQVVEEYTRYYFEIHALLLRGYGRAGCNPTGHQPTCQRPHPGTDQDDPDADRQRPRL